MKRIILILLIGLGSKFVHANQGLEFGLARPYPGTAVPGRPIISLSWFNQALLPLPGFTDYGFVAMLPLRKESPAPHSHELVRDFAGLYAGQIFLPFSGVVRPGFNLGWTWETRSISKLNGESRSDSHLSIYYAFKLQFSCLSFLISNKGIGGGFNFTL